MFLAVDYSCSVGVLTQSPRLLIPVTVKEEEEEILEVGVVDTLKEKSQIYTTYTAKEMDHMMHPHASFLGTKLSMKETNPKVKLMTKRKVKHLNPLTILWHTVILE